MASPAQSVSSPDLDDHRGVSAAHELPNAEALSPEQKRQIVRDNLATVRALDVVSKDALRRIASLRF